MKKLTVLILEQHVIERSHMWNVGRMPDGHQYVAISLPFICPQMAYGDAVTISFKEVREVSGFIPAARVVEVSRVHHTTVLYMRQAFVARLITH
jgi:hypothetical protein